MLLKKKDMSIARYIAIGESWLKTMSIYKTTINKTTIKNILKRANPVVEAIYNSLDAKATKIQIKVVENKNESDNLFGSFDIHIYDNGEGIPIDSNGFKRVFTKFQDSPKKDIPGTYGSKGQGRYKYLKLVSNNLKNIGLYTKFKDEIYQISYLLENDGAISFEVLKTDDKKILKIFQDEIKTVLIFKSIDKNCFEYLKDADKNERNLLFSNINELIATHIADKLIAQAVEVTVNGKKLDIQSYIFRKAEEEILFTNHKFHICYIIWKEELKLQQSKHILYFNNKDNFLFSTPSGSYRDTFGDTIHSHTVLVHGEYLDCVDELVYNQRIAYTSDRILNELQFHIISKFKEIQLDIWNKNTKRVSRGYQSLVSNISEKETDEVVNNVYHAMTLPFIYDNKIKPNEKLKSIIGRLLKVLIQASPNSYIENINYIAGLNEKNNEIFNYVRSNMDIIDIVMKKEKYIKYIDILEHFDKVVNGIGKKNIKERTQLQKIIEKNLWIIDEAYEQLIPDSFVSDQAYKTIFKKLGMSLYNDPDIVKQLSQITSKKDFDKIPDLFIPITSKETIHIIELKKPTVKISREILFDVQDKYIKLLDLINKQYNKNYTINAYAISSEKTGNIGTSMSGQSFTISVKLWNNLIENARTAYMEKLQNVNMKIKNSKWTSMEDFIEYFVERKS